MTAPAAAPRFNGSRVVGIRKGTPFLHRLAATGTAPLTFAASNLPAGLTLDAATGTISGSLAADGDSTIDVTVSNASGMAKSTLRVVVSNTLALTPPIGWNSYDSFDDAVKESEVVAQATWMRDHLQPIGWDLVVVDFRWYDAQAPASDMLSTNNALTADSNGRLQPSTNRFPGAANNKGFKSLGDQIHAMGLKFGIHIMRGIPRQTVNADSPIADSAYTAKDAVRGSGENGYVCSWNADMYGVKGDTAAGQAWYDSIFKQYAEWGVDFIKVDDSTKNRPANQVEYFKTEVEAIQKAIGKSGRSMVLSLSPGEALTSAADHMIQFANMWRMSDDFWDRAADLDHSFELAQRWAAIGGPGHWADEDMLPLGRLSPHCPVDGASRNTRFTKNEQQLMMSLWATLPSPYFLGANMVDSANDAFLQGLLQNEEIIAVQQDGAGKKAKRVSNDADSEVWSRELSGGKLLVAFFNRSANDKKQSVTVSTLGITEKRLVRNPWQRADLPAVTSTDTLEATVSNRAAALFVLSPETPPDVGGSGGSGGVGNGGVGGAASGSGGTSGGAQQVPGAGTAGVATTGGAGGITTTPNPTGGVAGTSVTTPINRDGTGDGCGCRAAGSSRFGAAAWLVAAAAFVAARRRRR